MGHHINNLKDQQNMRKVTIVKFQRTLKVHVKVYTKAGLNSKRKPTFKMWKQEDHTPLLKTTNQKCLIEFVQKVLLELLQVTVLILFFVFFFLNFKT